MATSHVLLRRVGHGVMLVFGGVAMTTIGTGGLAAQAARGEDAAAKSVVAGFGSVRPVPNAEERPDPRLRYRVVFNITKAASAPDRPNPSLDKVARFLNLLGGDNVRPAKGDVVAIIHGPATPLILTDSAYAARMKTAGNPNTPLVAALRQAGVSIRVCGQAMVAHDIAPEQVASGIAVDVSALTTLANLQLRGYALIPD